jgi:O-antigen/teichoic acid export membrane protein
LYATGNGSAACGGYNAKMLDLLPLANLRVWGAKGGLTVADQGISSVANFLTTILLARWLTLDQYGGYGLAFAVFQFALQLQNGVLLEPLSVLGPARHREDLSAYLSRQIPLHFILMTVAGAMVALAAAAFWAWGWLPEFSGTLLAVGVLLPLLTFPWLVRRILYVRSRPGRSAAASLLYGGILLATVLLLRAVGRLAPGTAIGAMAAAGLSTGVFIMPLRNDTRQIPRSALRSLLRESWQYGKWSTASGLLVAIAVQAQLVVTSGILGLGAAGVLRAAQNLIQPMAISITALAALALPSMSRDYGKGDFARLEQKLRWMTFLLVITASLYFLMLVVFKTDLIRALYGAKYAPYAGLLAVWGLVPIVMALNSGIGVGMKARQRPDLTLVLAIVWAVVSIGTGVWFTTIAGIWGAGVSAVLGYLIAYLGTIVLYRKAARSETIFG